MTYHMPTIVNGVARLLGHAMSVDDTVAHSCSSVTEWHRRALEARESVERGDGVGPSTPGPVAWWYCEGGTVSHTTLTGRLSVAADDEELTLVVEAGPDRDRPELAGTFIREDDGRYLWQSAGGIAPADMVEIGWEPDPWRPGRDRVWVSGITRPGRAILTATVHRDGNAWVEWVDPSLVEGRLDRLHHLVEIDREVFGGALAAADKRFAAICAQVAA